MTEETKILELHDDYNVPYYKDQNNLKAMLYSQIELANEMYSAADICFVCDITGSMDWHINIIKNILIDFVKNIRTIINTQPRIAFIGFRDKEDQNQIEFKDFTTEPKEITDYLENIDCTGGGDTCEDLITPLKHVLNLEWRSDLIYVYLLIDAPAHGKSYHKIQYSDDYPNDDENQILEKLAQHYRDNKINLVILKCNNSVDIMIEKIKQHYNTEYNQLSVIEMMKGDTLKEDFAKNFLITITKDIAGSLANSRYRNFRKIKHKACDSSVIDIDPDVYLSKPFEGILYTSSIVGLQYEQMKYDYKLKLRKLHKIDCIINGVNVGIGMFAECYKLQVDEDTNYVAKLPKIPVKSVIELKADIEGTLFATYFATQFNKFLAYSLKTNPKKGLEMMKINVLPLVIIENISKENLGRVKIFLAQKFLNGEYIKYNNNYGWVNRVGTSSSLLAQAFSHFTYEYSMGTLIIVDIQGTEENKNTLLLTDPAVHTLIYKDRFGETNHGKIGILRFFKNHECNDYCKLLYLSDPKLMDKKEIEEAAKKFKDKKGLSHLNKLLELNLEVWRKKFSAFNPDQILYDIKEECLEDAGFTTKTQESISR